MSLYNEASLVMVPSAYKDQKVYSVKPFDGSGDLTFSRGSDIEATRVNANGYIEKAQVNLVTYSEQFDNAVYSKSNCTITANQIANPLTGSVTADLLTATGGGTETNLRVLNVLQTNTVQTISVYVKYDNYQYFYIRQIATNKYGVFDIQNGTVSYQPNDASQIEIGIDSLGGGWYRLFYAFNASSMTNNIIDIGLSATSTSFSSGTVAAGSKAYLYGFQLNYGLVAQTYVPTTTAAVVTGITNDMPRLNYDPANPTCPSLLLEPSRTNLIPSSEYLSYSGYTLRTISVTENYAISPEGVQNASLLTPSGSDAAILENIAVTSGTTYAMSVWLKSATGSNVSTTIALGSAGFPEAVGDGGKYKNITVTTEWQRFSIVSTADASVGTDISIGGFSGLATGENILAYGWQFEVGSYVSSYIPTYGTSATRTDESMTSGTLSAVSGGEVSFFLDIDGAPNPASNSTSANFQWQFTSNWVAWNNNGSSNHRIRVTTSGGSEYFASSVSRNSRCKIVALLTATEAKVYANGTLVGTASISADWSTTNSLSTAITNSVGQVPINQLILFPTRLTEADAIAITSL